MSSALAAAVSASTRAFSSRNSAFGAASRALLLSCSASRRRWRSRRMLRERLSTCVHSVCWLAFRFIDFLNSDAIGSRSSARMSISGTANEGAAAPTASASKEARTRRDMIRVVVI
ncbi:hypothetical protein HH212_07660 [Massilia forsythiae]|uniref:Uncharacterized protein n=1 Tax=Massilia forsythiae TaxID=2728020 RepID=A0A7Z2VV80_9BURK|nr:hypothetical protein HH212_07660 [Massilia forsythiae]